jgi:hypothetical protein
MSLKVVFLLQAAFTLATTKAFLLMQLFNLRSMGDATTNLNNARKDHLSVLNEVY